MELSQALSHCFSQAKVTSLSPNWRAFSGQTKTRTITPTRKLSDFSLKCSNGLPPKSIGFNHGSEGLYKPTNSLTVSAQMEAVGPGSDDTKLANFLDASWRFLRPYAIYATVLAAVSLVTRSWLIENRDLFNWSLVLKGFSGLIALVSINAYHCGINQIYDIDIDRVNKPELPLASGELSMESAWLMTLFYAATGLMITGYTGGPFLFLLSCLALIVASLYSVPPFRLKRTSYGTIFAISTLRGLLLHTALCYSTRTALGLPFQWTPPAIFITTFATLFGVVISILKDLPDMEGDQKYGIKTFATQFGSRNVAFIGIGLMLFNYVAGILATIFIPNAFRPSVMIPAHALLAGSLIFRAWMLERANYAKEAASKFYLFIWQLCFVEYLLFPFI